MKIKLLLLLFFSAVLNSCQKEYSCENCIQYSSNPTIKTLDCTSSFFSDAAFLNTPYSGTCTIAYSGGNGIKYSSNNSIPSLGVTGLSATLVSGTLENGDGNFIYIINGTPTIVGTATFNISFNNQVCTIALIVDSLIYQPINTYNISIAAQKERSLVALSDGSVKAWGSNEFGQLGDGTNIKRTTPIQVNNLTNITAVATGAYHSLALRNDGTVWAWGKNDFGQLADGTLNENHSPKKIKLLSGVISIAAGYDYSMALKNDGTVWTWGSNHFGQLGDGRLSNKLYPVKVNTLSGIKEIAGGEAYCLALKNDGTVWAWGWNFNGALGVSTNIVNSNVPIKIASLNNIVKIASNGSNHSLALKNDGTVWAWGDNFHGQLGDGTYVEKNTPFKISSLNDIKSIGVGEDNSFAIKNDGTLFAWGWNAVGELGVDYNYLHQSVPINVSLLQGVKNICGGNFHTIIQKIDGTIWTMGGNVFGQLGDGSNTIYRFTPMQVNRL